MATSKCALSSNVREGSLYLTPSCLCFTTLLDADLKTLTDETTQIWLKDVSGGRCCMTLLLPLPAIATATKCRSLTLLLPLPADPCHCYCHYLPIPATTTATTCRSLPLLLPLHADPCHCYCHYMPIPDTATATTCRSLTLPATGQRASQSSTPCRSWRCYCLTQRNPENPKPPKNRNLRPYTVNPYWHAGPGGAAWR